MKRFGHTGAIFQIFCGTLLLATPVLAQDSNILHPIEEIEQKLQHESFDIFKMRDARFEGDLPKRVIVKWPDGKHMQLKWKRAPRRGWGVNNEPRYEIAAYRLQKLFLEPQEYVVPPTTGRTWPLSEYRKIEPGVSPTFSGTDCVFFCLQYWLEGVTSEGVYDKSRFRSDTTYAKHLANMNILSYLVKHKDANVGNFLVSSDPENPRVFVVDNSMAFASLESDKGVDWQDLRVDRLPKETVARLRQIQKEDLEKTLGVVAQFSIIEGQLVPAEKTENLAKKKGVRRSNGIIQFGLTNYEINGVYKRLRKLLKRVDESKVKTF
ncbi:MAG: hypothetical protein ACE5IY_05680 [bacterium]